jgi:hypothetical protein
MGIGAGGQKNILSCFFVRELEQKRGYRQNTPILFFGYHTGIMPVKIKKGFTFSLVNP